MLCFFEVLQTESCVYSTVFPAGTNAKFEAGVLLLSAAADVKRIHMFNPPWEGCSSKANLKHDFQNSDCTNPQANLSTVPCKPSNYCYAQVLEVHQINKL